MKKLLVLLLSFVSITAFADYSKYVQDDKAQELIAVLQDSGVKLMPTSKSNIFKMIISNINCSYFSMAAYDNELGGLSRVACYREAKSIGAFNKTGILMNESRTLQTLLSDISGSTAADPEHYFMDCAMGKCGGSLKRIYCEVNTTVETFKSGGRFTCNLRFVE